jgi:hypothetical protein
MARSYRCNLAAAKPYPAKLIAVFSCGYSTRSVVKIKAPGISMPGVRIFPKPTWMRVLFVGAWRSRSRIRARIGLTAGILIAARQHAHETQQCDKGY